jgi:hypothetical protein
MGSAFAFLEGVASSSSTSDSGLVPELGLAGLAVIIPIRDRRDIINTNGGVHRSHLVDFGFGRILGREIPRWEVLKKLGLARVLLNEILVHPRLHLSHPEGLSIPGLLAFLLGRRLCGWLVQPRWGSCFHGGGARRSSSCRELIHEARARCLVTTI